MSTKKLLTQFPAEGLRTSRRFITSHNKDGKGVFVVDDVGDHHRVLAQGLGVGNIIYSTAETPVDMNDDKDMFYARDNEVKLSPSQLSVHPVSVTQRARLLTPTCSVCPQQPGIHVANGSVVRLIDFAPGCESPVHRAMSIDYGVVIEGKFLLTLDSGESKVMVAGDMSKCLFTSAPLTDVYS